MTNEGKRNASKVEFDNTYFVIDDDIENLISTNFGLKGEKYETHKDYINRKKMLLERMSQNLFIHLKVANGLYPTCKAHLEERQAHQKCASGLCYAIATMYERIFRHIGVPRDKYTEEIQHIQKEINSIKSWRDSDRKRFKF